jgi:hypothetical protein
MQSMGTYILIIVVPLPVQELKGGAQHLMLAQMDGGHQLPTPYIKQTQSV